MHESYEDKIVQKAKVVFIQCENNVSYRLMSFRECQQFFCYMRTVVAFARTISVFARHACKSLSL